MATISVAVGNGSYVFSPNSIKANVGDIVEFDFFPKDHSVAQASFSNPCHPLPGGFYSNYVPTSTSPSNKTFSIIINDTNAIYFYCTQHLGYHCQTGEVGVINPPETGDTLEAFATLAKNATNSTSPLAPNAGAVGGVLSIKGESGGNSTSSTTTPAISAPTSPTSTPIHPAGSSTSMATFNYSILAVAITLFAMCIFGGVGFWLNRNQAKQSSKIMKFQEPVNTRQLGKLEESPAELGEAIPLPELSSGGLQRAELPPTHSPSYERENSRDTSCQKIHALSFV